MATALITGGTSGIGAAFGRALGARGDDLILVARNADRLATTATALKDRYNVAVETLTADLANRDDVQRVADRLSSTQQPVSTLVNNAGFGIPAKLLDPDTTPQEQAIEVMVRAVMILSVTAGRVMRERDTGTIINVSSTAGFVTLGHYSAIKAYVTTFTEALDNELAGSGVTATALCPGWVRTEFHQRASIRTGSIPGPMWLDADELVAECLEDVAAGKVVSIPSFRYKVMMAGARHAPRAFVRAASRRLASGRH
jgi:short-subunit dehydrogenase